jgi:hypothetical protein
MEHSFNTKVAEICGIEEAILLNNIFHWVLKNKSNGKHFYENRYWTYNSYRAFADLFPYMAPEKIVIKKDGSEVKERELQRIRRSIKKLTEAKLLIDGNFNKKGYDRTKWYSLTDFAFELLSSDKNVSKETVVVSKTTEHGIKINTPIPDSKQQIINTDKIKLHSSDFSETKIEGTPNEDFSSSTEENIQQPETLQEEPRKEPNSTSHPFKMTDEDIEYLRPYHNGLIEEINKLAKVNYSKKINSICKAYHYLKKNNTMLKCIYTYFRTYRNAKDEYAVVVHSLESFANKIEKLMNEAEKQTRELETKNKSSIYHIDHERKIIVFNSWQNIPQTDIETLKTYIDKENYMGIPMKPLVGQYKPYNRQPEIPKRNTFA